MGDRFMNGFISGIIAGFFGSAVNLFLVELLEIGTIRYFDVSGIFIYGRHPKGLNEDLFAFVGYLAFAGMLGIVWSYLIPHIRSRYFVIKTVIYGVGIWFSIYAVTFLYKVQDIKNVSLQTAFSNFAASVAFGLGLAFTMLWLIRRKEII